MDKLRVASVQFQHAPGDKAANLATVARFVSRAADAGAHVVTFPECCISGYWHLRKLSRKELLALAEPVPAGPASQRLGELAVKHKAIVGAGLVELADDGKMYNSYVVATPEGQFHCHRKIHMFISEHLTCGSQYTVFDTAAGWRLGVLTCYDNNIVENGRMMGLAGVDLLLAPHQTGGCASRSKHTMGVVSRKIWDNREADPSAIEAEFKGDKGRAWILRWLPSRAHDNGMFIAFSNGVGPDDDEVRTGNAMILDPYGRILAETWRARDAMVTADLDPDLLEGCTGRRWIQTRRPDLYAPLTVPTGQEIDMRASRFAADGKL
ncbi:MAG: (R)-stereoselective amidase [Phycisphaerae bacterium]|nr:(R)-stereoselective amidase [Phycisphaerae bacterium]